MNPTLDLLVDAQNYLGEGVLWCERSRSVFWTDIEASRLYRYTPHNGASREWTLPERLCCFAFTADAGVLLVGLASRLAFFNLDSGEVTAICEVEAGLPTRLNDGRCDRQGRFVFGTMDQSAPRQAIASFYRLNHDLTLERLPLPQIAISNSICFSPDGGAMYFTDSMHKAIYRWDDYLGGDGAKISLFTDLGAGSAAADGATVDADGYLWSAQWGGARVARYAPDGSLDRVLDLPVSQPSCVCFGGAGLQQLFVTTAQEHLSAARLAEEKVAGGLFHALLGGVTGLPENRFGGAP